MYSGWTLTMVTTESLAANATISAHETTPGHASSSKLLIPSMKSNPRSVWFGTAAFSAVLFAVEFIRTDPSQPYQEPLTKENQHIFLILYSIWMNCNCNEGAKLEIFSSFLAYYQHFMMIFVKMLLISIIISYLVSSLRWTLPHWRYPNIPLHIL